MQTCCSALLWGCLISNDISLCKPKPARLQMAAPAFYPLAVLSGPGITSTIDVCFLPKGAECPSCERKTHLSVSISESAALPRICRETLKLSEWFRVCLQEFMV